MYICSFMLVKRPPVADVDLREVAIGELTDGIFTTDEFPALVRLGAVIEVILEPEDAGEYEVGIGIADADASIRASQSGAEIDVAVADEIAPLVVPHADIDWKTPRHVALPFSITYETDDESDDMLWAVLLDKDGEAFDYLDRAVIVRRASHLPDYLP